MSGWLIRFSEVMELLPESVMGDACRGSTVVLRANARGCADRSIPLLRRVPFRRPCNHSMLGAPSQLWRAKFQRPMVEAPFPRNDP